MAREHSKDTMASSYQSPKTGKARDQTTAWSDWLWDERGYYVASRYGPTGIIEYEFRDPDNVPLRPQNSEGPPLLAFTTTSFEGATPYNPLSSVLVANSYQPTGYYTQRPADWEIVQRLSGATKSTNADALISRPTIGEGFQRIDEPSRFFKTGRVFKTMWAEPAGFLEESDAFVMTSNSGEKFYSKVRHFVVAREMQGCCFCLPLNTHNGKAATKAGANPENYTAVFAMGSNPVYKDGEFLSKIPIPIIVENTSEGIHPSSRINFGRVYTVEHNVKVLKVGRIPDDHLSLLVDYFVSAMTPPHYTGAKVIENTDEQSLTSSLQTFSFSPRGFQQINQPEQNDENSYSSSSRRLDHRYRAVESKNQSKFFRIGRVFMMLWTEPARMVAQPASTSADSSASSNLRSNNTAYSEVRRFVVIKQGHGNTICSPIHTYNKQGTLKPNLPDRHQHAIIYTSDTAPPELYVYRDGVKVFENLRKEPIRVRRERQDRDGELDVSSRINYSKIYTVENYVRVLNIGMVHQDSMQALIDNALVKGVTSPLEKPRRNRRPRPDDSERGRGRGEGQSKALSVPAVDLQM